MSSMPKIILAIISIVFLVSCGTTHNQQEDNMPAKSIEETLAQYTNELMSIPGVIGVAQGLQNNKPCITVLAMEKTPELKKKIPKTLGGYPVEIVETGEIKPLQEKN